MDSRLKERLIGAIALVAIVVIVVPELLTGQRTPSRDPAPAGTVPQRTVSFVIGSAQPGAIARAGSTPATAAPAAAPPPATEAAAAAPAGTAPADAAGGSAESLAEPATTAPAAASSSAPASSAVPSPRPAAPMPSPAPRAASVAHTGEAWIVQIGSFGSRDNAERLAASLRGKSYAAFVSEFRGSRGVLYRVRVGPEHDHARADALAARLAHEGHPGSVAPEP